MGPAVYKQDILSRVVITNENLFLDLYKSDQLAHTLFSIWFVLDHSWYCSSPFWSCISGTHCCLLSWSRPPPIRGPLHGKRVHLLNCRFSFGCGSRGPLNMFTIIRVCFARRFTSFDMSTDGRRSLLRRLALLPPSFSLLRRVPCHIERVTTRVVSLFSPVSLFPKPTTN
jgi:hypothetical protein